MSMVIVFVAAAAGALAGVAGRILLSRNGISPPRWCCEIVVAVLWAAVTVRAVTGALPWWWLPVPLALIAFAVPLAVADFRSLRLPDALTVPAYPVLGGAAIGAALLAGSPRLVLASILGAVVFAGAHAAVHAVRGGALGPGDVKLSGSLGAVLGVLGVPALVVAAVLASALTLLLGGIARLVRPQRWRHGIPHGPGMLAAATVLAVFPALPSVPDVAWSP